MEERIINRCQYCVDRTDTGMTTQLYPNPTENIKMDRTEAGMTPSTNPKANLKISSNSFCLFFQYFSFNVSTAGLSQSEEHLTAEQEFMSSIPRAASIFRVLK